MKPNEILMIEKLKEIILLFHTMPIHESVSTKALEELHKLEKEYSKLESEQTDKKPKT